MNKKTQALLKRIILFLQSETAQKHQYTVAQMTFWKKI